MFGLWFFVGFGVVFLICVFRWFSRELFLLVLVLVMRGLVFGGDFYCESVGLLNEEWGSDDVIGVLGIRVGGWN